MSTRLEEIRQIVELSPDDPFPRYGLAMEYKNAGQHEEALATFADLQRRHPGYVAQYLMHGNLLASLRRKDEARKVYEAGIAQARNNAHARGELQAALEGLDGGEDQDE